MNIALSILSAAASAEAAGTAEAYSGPWENVYNAVHSTAEAVTEEAQGVVDRIQGLGDAHAQLADPDYWGSVGIITLTGILVVFFILAILIFLFWALGKTFQTIDKNRAAKAEAAKKAAEDAKAAADRVIGDVREDGLAALIEELWFDGPKAVPSGRDLGSAWDAMEKAGVAE